MDTAILQGKLLEGWFNSHFQELSMLTVLYDGSRTAPPDMTQSRLVKPLIKRHAFRFVMWVPVSELQRIPGNKTLLAIDAVEQAIQDARTNRRDTASTLFAFPPHAKAPADHIAFVHPVFAQTTAQLQGMIIGVVELQPFLEQGVYTKHYASGMRMHVYDHTDENEATLLFYGDHAQRDVPQRLEHPVVRPYDPDNPPPFVHSLPMDVNSRQWTVVFTPSAIYFSKATENSSWLVLFLGLGLTGVAIAFVFYLITRNVHVSRLVESRTKELQDYMHDLERSNQELDEFAYIASHDLKEPLRGIHNFASFLLEDYGTVLDEAGQAKLHTLTQLSQRMERLLDSLLYYSRVGRVALAIREVNLNETIREVVAILQPRLTETQTEIRIPRPLPIVVCDHTRVAEVFQNLITNAMKYNNKAERWIEIGYEEVPNKSIRFYVKDNGIGIASQHYDSIFRIFKRLHGKQEYGGGTGSGLTLCKKIIERHNGRIWVESELDKGSIFYFTLGGDHDE